MSGIEEVFHPAAADARRDLDAQKEIPAPAPSDAPPLMDLDGAVVVIPSLDSLTNPPS